MDQVVILLVIAGISFVNWLVKKSAERRELRRREAAAANRQNGEASELEDSDIDEPENWQAPPEDLRKFMEALGLPVEPPLKPTPKVQEVWQPPEADIPKISVPPKLPEQPVVGFRKPKVVKPSEEAKQLAKRLEAKSGKIQTRSIGHAAGYREMLRSRKGMQEAIILREILSPPKALE